MFKLQSISIFLIILILFSVGCSRNAYKFDSSSVAYYPPPPDTARIQFLTSISNSGNIEKQRSGFGRFLLGDLPIRNIYKPYGIETYQDKIYICDTDLGGLEIIDLEKKKFDYFIPKGKGRLAKPINCSHDTDGKLYVADWKRRQVVVFDEFGNYITAFGEPGDFKPTDVTVFESLVFVVDKNSNKIYVYNKNTYTKLYSFPETEPGMEDWIYTPTNISVEDSIVYVSDIGAYKIKMYSIDGRYINSIGSHGRGLGQFVRVKGIDVDKNLNIYAVDAAFENVQIFNNKGQLLMFFGGSSKDPGGLWLPADITIDYDNLTHFNKYVDPEFSLEYLVFVTNQYGPSKVNVYGFIKPKKNKNE